ncbi:MAG: PEP-CTERM sorting domain-containing protein [Armatimonadota bacterium]
MKVNRAEMRGAVVVLAALVLALGCQVLATADPWPDWDREEDGGPVLDRQKDTNYVLPVTVTAAIVPGTGWDFTLTVGECGAYSVNQFAVYVLSGNPLAYHEPLDDFFDGGNDFHWSQNDGGWELEKLSNDSRSAAFGWIAGGGHDADSIKSGESGTFHAKDLDLALLSPDESGDWRYWDLYAAVHVVDPIDPVNKSYYQKVNYATGGKVHPLPPAIPEPTTLALLATGGVGLLPLLRRRRKV